MNQNYSTWQHWVNLILAIWIIISGYLNFAPADMTTNLTIVGIVMAVVALWGGLQNQSELRSAHQV